MDSEEFRSWGGGDSEISSGDSLPPDPQDSIDVKESMEFLEFDGFPLISLDFYGS